MNLHVETFGRAFDPFSLESNVRSYCRRIPPVFARARNAEVWDEHGTRYIDFLSACGALNYGHNHPLMKSRLVEYIANDGITTSMDLHTRAKRDFLARLDEAILRPHGLDYAIQFTGPTGANAVEAALKLARKATGRQSIIAFSDGFHGMSLGALAATANPMARKAAGVPLAHVHRLPFNDRVALSGYRQKLLASVGLMPAGFIVETVQGEGGLNVASAEWLRDLSALADEIGALLIIDDIQAGCGRTGTFFSFTRAGIEPDVVCLAKSLSGFGLPMALVLMKPEHDCWLPAEHNGTFRGNNHAFVTAAAALNLWMTTPLADDVAVKAAEITRWLNNIVQQFPGSVWSKGMGLMQGLAFRSTTQAELAAACALANGVIVELCGPYDEVIKIMPPLTIEMDILREGLAVLAQAVTMSLEGHLPERAA